MELLVPLHAGGKPLYEQIYQYVKSEIRTGRLKAGERLPSTRILAQNLKVSRSTTQMAYDQLFSEGYIESVPCRGYFVSQIEALVEVERSGGGGLVAEERGKEEYRIDFSPRGIDLDSFPYNLWRKLSRNTLADDQKQMFLVGDPQGEYRLRAAIGAYLHSARGVNCRPEQIVIGAGSEYLLMLLSQLLGRETRIALENPTYKQAYRVFCSLGHTVLPLPMDHQGMVPGLLEQSGAAAAYVMPSHQYPTGIVIPVGRRQELLAWAYRQEGRYLIEDDYDSEFRYRGKPIPALQGMDHGGKVIYMGTFSRSVAPAIRVGFMVLPEALLKKYKETASFYASTVSRIDQNILYQFIKDGHYERHLNRMRAVYKGKQDLLLSGLEELRTEFEIRGEYAGTHVLLTDRSGRSEEELERLAGAAGVKTYGMSEMVIGEEKQMIPSTVILGYASLKGEEIREGCRLLCRAWKQANL